MHRVGAEGLAENFRPIITFGVATYDCSHSTQKMYAVSSRIFLPPVILDCSTTHCTLLYSCEMHDTGSAQRAARSAPTHISQTPGSAPLLHQENPRWLRSST
jgi:hypothetical protein